MQVMSNETYKYNICFVCSTNENKIGHKSSILFSRQNLSQFDLKRENLVKSGGLEYSRYYSMKFRLHNPQSKGISNKLRARSYISPKWHTFENCTQSFSSQLYGQLRQIIS